MKKYFFSMAVSFIGLICFMIFNIKGSTVLPDGRLVEPFYLIPIGFLFIAIGIISSVVIAIISKLRKSRKKQQ